MRIVKWNPQERADAPDLTAMSYLVLGEFRRMVRGTLIGTHAVGNYVIDGFQVEATSPLSNAVEVTLDTAGALSFAFGAELIGSRVDYGQLMGGDNSDGATEGNAVQTLDFTGQPAATYTVQMRPVYADAVPDNRAFWNATGDTEFIAQVNTRTLPQYELRRSGAPSAEWMDLADVVWDAIGPIGPGNITDKRDFAFEGVSPYTQTTKLGTGALPDFARVADRGIATVGRNGIYPALKALGRQIQDIKGPDDNGEWNWWNDAYLPMRGAVAPHTRDRTTSLRSLRTVHYTVGDGVTTFGDFNGYGAGSGLDQCLAYIDLNENSLDCHAIIQILANGDGAGDDVFEIGNYSFSHTLLEIRGGGGNPTGTGHTWWGSRIECTGTLTTPAITVSGAQSGIIFRNLKFIDGGANAKVLLTDTQSHVEMHSCHFEVDGSPTLPIVEIGGGQVVHIADTRFQGAVRFDGACANIGTWDRCSFADLLVIEGAANAAFNSCAFDRSASNGRGLATLDDANHITFQNCRLTFPDQDSDLVHIGGATPCNNIQFRGCRFSHTLSGIPHGVNAGLNGSAGTGWHIFIDNTGAAVTLGYGFVVSQCLFEGDEVSDAGAVYAVDAHRLLIEGNEVRDFDLNGPVGSAYCRPIRVEGSAPGHEGRVQITGNTVHQWGPTGLLLGLERSCIFGNQHNGLLISGNQMESTQVGEPRGVFLVGCEAARITDNQFTNFDGASARATYLLSSTRCTIQGNTYYNCKQAIAVGTSGVGYHAITGNTIDGNGLAENAQGVIELNQLRNTCSDNTIHNYSGVYLAINLRQAEQVIIGNRTDASNIQRNGTTGHTGYFGVPASQVQSVNGGFFYV